MLAARTPLAPLTTLNVGGPARWFVRATSVEQVRAAVTEAAERDIPLFVLGGGSNLVVADAGIDGLVLQIGLHGQHGKLRGHDTILAAAAGESWDAVVEAAVRDGLGGIECLSGIPGTVGGTPVQNVGAYGQEVSQVIESVSVIDRHTGSAQELNASDCQFAYRMSRFKGADKDRFIVTGVTFRLRHESPTLAYPDLIAYMNEHAIMSPDVRDVRNAVLAIRRRKGMVLDPADADTRSVGSFFMNPVVTLATHAAVGEIARKPAPSFPAREGHVKLPAAWLIERAGFVRGHAAGAVGLSRKHPLAIVNRGGATARDVVRLAVEIKRAVAGTFGVELRTEPVFAGFDDDPDVAYLSQGPNVDTAD